MPLKIVLETTRPNIAASPLNSRNIILHLCHTIIDIPTVLWMQGRKQVQRKTIQMLSRNVFRFFYIV